MSVKDTSKDYDDMTDKVSVDDIKYNTIAPFIDTSIEKETLKIREKPCDPDFPETWQTLHVRFFNKEDYISFMKLINEAPASNPKKLIYRKEKKSSLNKFFGG
jgi:hypothetical protein